MPNIHPIIPLRMSSGIRLLLCLGSIVCGCLILLSCSSGGGPSFLSDWEFSPDGPWAGPELWANRLQDWQVAGGQLECLSTLPLRTVHLTTLCLQENEGELLSRVRVKKLAGGDAEESAVGFLLGAGKDLDFRAASLIHHAYGNQAGLFVGIDGRGHLFVRDLVHKDKYLIFPAQEALDWDEIVLEARIFQEGGQDMLGVSGLDPVTQKLVTEHVSTAVPAGRLQGGVALVSHAGHAGESVARFAFRDWRISGSRLMHFPERNLGPMVTALYTLSRGTVKLTAQFMPLSTEENQRVELFIKPNGSWEQAASSTILHPSCTAPFRIDNWAQDQDVPFRLEYTLHRETEQRYVLAGSIKRDPFHKEALTMISMSCVKQVVKPSRTSGGGLDQETYPWDWGVLYPHAGLTEQLKKHDPDVLFFAGDQVYESSSPTRADVEHAFLDYLYKWYLWCISNRPLTTRIPTLAIPDDHDVYHGNLWGAGGKATPPGLRGAAAQDQGGYKMSPEFVNMVEATQTSHMPDPFDPEPVDQGIGVYFTECNIGGLSIAVIEDRKFKSAPGPLLPEAGIVNGWVQNPDWNPRIQGRIPDAVLLGERQLRFLEHWAGDWSHRTWMKAVVSQTLFANVATLPQDATSDGVVPSLEIPEPGTYVRGDKLVSDFDSNGWPQEGRDRALRLFRKAFATHIVGDQHLASTCQYGVDDWRDAGFVIVSPATGNLFPRRWWPPEPGLSREPGSPEYTGDFTDGFGNKVTVFAVANPRKTERHPSRHHELATGYSIITFHKQSREIELSNWPYWADPDTDGPFEGWPIRIHQAENYGREARAWLPELHIEGLDNPVVQIIEQRTDEVVYTVRLSGHEFQPKVFVPGLYTIRVGEPDSQDWMSFADVRASVSKDMPLLEVKF
jgi:alkaline phosphatase D